MRLPHRCIRPFVPAGALALTLLLAGCAPTDDPPAEGDVVEDLTGEPADDGDANGASEDGDQADPAEGEPAEGEAADGDQDADADGAPIDPAGGDIDGDDVDAVLGDLLAAQSEVLRDVVGRDAGEVLTDDDEDRLAAVLSGPRLEEVRGTYLRYAQLDSAREPLLVPDEIGDLGWRTAEVVEVDDTCVLAIGSYDLTETSQEPYPDDLRALVSLRYGDDDGGGASDRSSGWRINDLATLLADGEPIGEEDWGRIEYGRVVERTCDH